MVSSYSMGHSIIDITFGNLAFKNWIEKPSNIFKNLDTT